jgi:predicted SPOUT superfamily RNA methylase MTH1
MIKNSAGVPREFVRILRSSCVKAISRGFDAIEADTVHAVIVNMRNEYDRLLEKRHLDVLNAVNKNEPVQDHKTLMELFHAKLVLEYLNGALRKAVNPIIKPFLEEKPSSTQVNYLSGQFLNTAPAKSMTRHWGKLSW